MNYLALVQRLSRECGVAGNGPTTVLNQSGEAGRLVNWIQDAWNDIQTMHQDWEFLRSTTSWTTIAGQATYTPLQCGIADGVFGMWVLDSCRNYDTAAGINSQVEMPAIGYDEWRRGYSIGSLLSVRTRPAVVAITPNKSLALGPYPAAGYTMTSDFFTAPVTLSADTDIPALPTQYHMAIVYRAMMSYAAFESAQEVYQRGELEFSKLINRLEIDRLPEIGFAGALC